MKSESASKTYMSNIVCPHCGAPITVRGRVFEGMDRPINGSLDKAFESINAAFDSINKTFGKLRFR